MRTFLIIALGLTALVLMAEASENRKEEPSGDYDFESQQDDDNTSGEGSELNQINKEQIALKENEIDTF